MPSNVRPAISFCVARVCCLATALFVMPATAAQNSWTAIGPDGISVTALAIDPHTPSTAFAGTLGSGILKSTDAGTSWTAANLGLQTPYIHALAIDPLTPSTLYAGTDVGVFKSTDGGDGWSAATAGLVDSVKALAIDPTSPTTLYAATVNGVFKTIDGGANWISIGAGLSGLMPSVVAVDPKMPSTLYIGVDDSNFPAGWGVFKSVDGGTNWTRIYTTPYDPLVNEGPAVRAIAIDRSSPSRIYVALRTGQIVRSTDGGTSWNNIASPLSDFVSLAIDPASLATLYAGTYSGEILRTTDAGAEGLPVWLPVTQGHLASSSINAMALALSTPAMIFAGGDTGIYRSSDDAQTWTRLTLGVRNIGANPSAVDPSASSTIYSTVGGVVVKTTDGGGHWAEMANGLTLDPLVTNFLVIDPAVPATIYTGRGNSAHLFDDGPVYKSIDGGAHWADASHGLPNLAFTGVETLAIASSLSATLYASLATLGVFKSVDSGVSWRQVNNGLPADGTYTALAIDPTNADTVYVATLPITAASDAKVFKSTDGAGQWRQVPISGPAAAVITTLAVDPATPSTIYASYGYGTDDFENAPSGFIFKSIDSGATWTAAQNGGSSPTGFVYALAIDRTAPSRIYAGTSNGVFMSTDAAANWTPINDGLAGPDRNVLAISVDQTGSILRAATPTGLFEDQMVGPEVPATVAVIEYFHIIFDDYFITSNPDEIRTLDNGAFPGWARTGFQFNAYAALEVPAVSVCRFFSTGFAPKSTHFYTPFASECAALGLDPNWELEGASAFAIALPGADGVCGPGLIPVYRFYNLSRGGVPNHRYTIDPAVRAQMIGQGWVPEGLGPNAVEMCSPM